MNGLFHLGAQLSGWYALVIQYIVSEGAKQEQEVVKKKVFAFLRPGGEYVIFDFITSVNQPYLTFLNFR